MSRDLHDYIEEVKFDVAHRVESEGEGVSYEDKFTEYCMQVLESIGKTAATRVLSYNHPNDQGGTIWKINGYCFNDLMKDDKKQEYYETIDLFITFYQNDYHYNLTKDDYTKSLNQIKRFIQSALKSQIQYIDPSYAELNHLISVIGQQGTQFGRVNVYFLTNGISRHYKEKIDINDIDVFIHMWDIQRLFETNRSNREREPIEIDFENFDQDIKGLPCLQVPNVDETYQCYLAIVPGEILAELYKEYSNELLESNVRAFLGQMGKFNKGIRDTIRFKPHMFLPYNNGITATAEKIETKMINNQMVITKLTDFQIVNGGQTTASLYHTKKKFKEVDLSKIFVQMKLTVIKDKELKNNEIPNISRFANSQNKVSELDLSSNNPHFIQIENLSRRKYVINPENKNQSLLWFFERVNGQYREAINKQTLAQQKKFKKQNPLAKKIVKSDVAKFINLWELEPHFVSQGAQKNFIHYMMKKIGKTTNKTKDLDVDFYCTLISNAILYKTTNTLFGRKNQDAIGDTSLKSFTVAYAISYLHFLTNNQLDLHKIYEQQTIDKFLGSHIKKILVFVYAHLTNEAHGSLISEYAKRQSSWDKLKNVTYPENLMLCLKDYLISQN